MHYCKTRYYVPLWGRWLNADSPYCLDQFNILENNLFTYSGNNPINRLDLEGNKWDWGIFFRGLFMLATAVAAVALSVTTFGAGIPVGMSIVAGVTAAAGVLTGVNAVATMVEASTDYNFVRDGLFNEVLGLDDSTYDIYSNVVEGIAIVGTMILGAYHCTGQYKASKASQKFLGKGYKKAGKNRWISSDSFRQVRWDTTHHMYKGKPSGLHFNWETFSKPIAKGVRNEITKDVHVWVKWLHYYY